MVRFIGGNGVIGRVVGVSVVNVIYVVVVVVVLLLL
jgi:hypothetical protein